MEYSNEFYIHVLQNMKGNLAKRKKPIEQIIDEHISAFGEDARKVCEFQEKALERAINALMLVPINNLQFEILDSLYHAHDIGMHEAELLNRFVGMPDGGVNRAKGALKDLIALQAVQQMPRNRYHYRITYLGLNAYMAEKKKHRKLKIKKHKTKMRKKFRNLRKGVFRFRWWLAAAFVAIVAGVIVVLGFFI